MLITILSILGLLSLVGLIIGALVTVEYWIFWLISRPVNTSDGLDHLYCGGCGTRLRIHRWWRADRHDRQSGIPTRYEKFAACPKIKLRYEYLCDDEFYIIYRDSPTAAKEEPPEKPREPLEGKRKEVIVEFVELGSLLG